MIPWNDAACVLFTCVAVNHLGLVGAVERAIHHEIPIVNCPKCLTFWGTLAYCLWQRTGVLSAVTVSLLGAYAAVWLELAMGMIDRHYTEAYEKTYKPTEDGASAADADAGDTASAVSDVQEGIGEKTKKQVEQ